MMYYIIKRQESKRPAKNEAFLRGYFTTSALPRGSHHRDAGALRG